MWTLASKSTMGFMPCNVDTFTLHTYIIVTIVLHCGLHPERAEAHVLAQFSFYKNVIIK